MVESHNRYTIGEWQDKSCETWWANIFVAGNYEIAEMVCRKHTFPSGLCVTIERTEYFFGGGSEKGVRIGLIQYPPFQEPVSTLINKAVALGKSASEANYQFSFTIVMPERTLFFSRRKNERG